MAVEWFVKVAVIDVLWPYVVEYILDPLAGEAQKRIGAFLFEYVEDLVPDELVKRLDGEEDLKQQRQVFAEYMGDHPRTGRSIVQNLHSRMAHLPEKEKELLLLPTYATDRLALFLGVIGMIQGAVKAHNRDLVLQGFFNGEQCLTLFPHSPRGGIARQFPGVKFKAVSTRAMAQPVIMFPESEVVVFAKGQPDLHKQMVDLNNEIYFDDFRTLRAEHYEDKEPRCVRWVFEAWVRYESDPHFLKDFTDEEERAERRITDPGGMSAMIRSLLDLQRDILQQPIIWKQQLDELRSS